MKLTDIQIDRYGPLPRFAHECEDNFEVFYGPNESGKTLLLEGILKLLAPDIDTALPHVSRVEEAPSGHVVVQTAGTEQKLGNGTVLTDLAISLPDLSVTSSSSGTAICSSVMNTTSTILSPSKSAISIEERIRYKYLDKLSMSQSCGPRQ